MDVERLEIRDLASLGRWKRRLWSTTWQRKLPVAQFAFHELSSEQNQSLSVRAASLRNACGCVSSGLFMSVTVVATVVSYFLSGQRLFNVSLADVLSLVGLTVLAALSGKLSGLIWARFRLLQLAARVNDAVLRIAQPEVSRQTSQVRAEG